MTEAERQLLLLVADALLEMPAPPVVYATRRRLIAAVRAIEANAAPQRAPQGGHQDADAYYDALQADAASDAHSPGTGRVG